MRRIDKVTIFLLLIFVANSLYFTISLIISDNAFNFDLVRSLAAYFNIILIFTCILNLPQKQIKKLTQIVHIIFFVLLGIGILQYLALLINMTDTIQFLVPRAQGAALESMGGRGVTLLASEPARAGIELAFLYLFIRLNRTTTKWNVVYDIAILGYIVVIIKAASAALFILFILMLLIANRPKDIFIWIFVAIMGLFFFDIKLSGRFITLIASLSEFDTIKAAIFFIANESGHRILALYSFVKAGILMPIGYGIGNWQEASIMAIKNSGINFSDFRYFQIRGNGDAISVRAPGVIPNLMLDVGIIGVAFFCYWIFYVTKKFRKHCTHSTIILIILFVKITLFGSLGNPVPWVITALLLRVHYQRATMNKATISSFKEQSNKKDDKCQ